MTNLYAYKRILNRRPFFNKVYWDQLYFNLNWLCLIWSTFFEFNDLGGVGVTVVSTRCPHLCDPGSIPVQCSYQFKKLKFHLGRM